MRFLWRWFRRLALAVLLIAAILALPVLRNALWDNYLGV